MNILKQSTAATIKLGPFVDDTDGKTAETALTIGQADIRLSKNGGEIAQTNNATGATHDEFGYYDIPLNTTDTGTLGRLRVLVSKAGALPVWQDFLVVTANVFDTFCSTGSLNVNAESLSTDAITAASVKADAVTKIQNGLALEATLTAIKGAGWSTETLAAIDVLIDAIKVKTDLMNASAITITPPVVGSTITILRGDTFIGESTDLGSLATYVSLDFTVKRNTAFSDDDAVIRVRKNASGLLDGLLRLNGTAHTTGSDGSLTITDALAGDVTITLKANITDDLATGTYVYDIQLIEAGEVSTLTSGVLNVVADVTRLVS